MDSRARRNRRKNRISLVTNIIFCLITLSALTGCIILLLQNYSLKNKGEEVSAQLAEAEARREDYIYTQTDVEVILEETSAQIREEEKNEFLKALKAKMSNGGATVSMLRDFFPEDVVVYADGEYSFFPISETLKKHDYVYDNFRVQENEQIVYVDDTDETLSKKGIDVSKYQEDINWSRVAGDGVEYAFIRAGARGSTEGKLAEDEKFTDNIKGALANKIDVGVYFFSQAITEEEAVEEAEFVLNMIKPYDISYPVVYDLEEVTSKNARTAGMTKEDYTNACIAFCETIQAAGYKPMIYGNLKTFMIMLDLSRLEKYDKWFAYYGTPVYFPYEFAVWQYSSKGNVNGIDGKVDLNIAMKDFSAG